MRPAGLHEREPESQRVAGDHPLKGAGARVGSAPDTGQRHVDDGVSSAAMNEPASTWAEFVEAGLLRSCRREHDVPLKELRDFIERPREEFQVPNLLADRRPNVGSGRRLLVDLQDRSHHDPEFCLVAVANGQIVLTAPGEEFYERMNWSGDEPAAGLASAIDAVRWAGWSSTH
jgi:hypothetical protein